MKIILRTLLLIAYIGQGAAIAHQDHNEITSETALGIANKFVQQLTFKDFGYEVGQLNESWKSLTEANFSVIEVLEKSFIVSAANSSTNTVIYFEIAKNGSVLSVNASK
ncbi:DUF6488 family protein [Paraglaciecola arctica]|uniref:Uncharacterized protein n=1 Tax=Paraglaciecola arctica BSs20135 TaxID=493475 RepID=K6ZB61_9ALTE|nr:DUF6488 family protein [Paraglaciecola arctica]GAC20680.1 hypothetical protein GARC_3726 [Paraglaciecola arctica BSs20135]